MRGRTLLVSDCNAARVGTKKVCLFLLGCLLPTSTACELVVVGERMARPSASELCAQLTSSSADVIAGALSSIRASTRLRADEIGEYGETIVSPSDARLTLACELCTEKAIPRILEAWDVAEQRDVSTLRVLVCQALAQILHLLSAHQPNHSHGEAMLEALVGTHAQYMPRLQAMVELCTRARKETASQDAVSVLVALKLLTAMASFARGRSAHQVWERFHWTSDIHAKLLSMRRRAHRGDIKPVTMLEPDVRTQYLLFLGSMLTQTYHSSLKIALLELGQEGLPRMVSDLAHDPPALVRYVLLVLHEDLFKDTHVPRGIKAKVMTETAITSLLQLYRRENDFVAHTSVADLVHHFLLSVCTHPGFGVCYADRGWYGREGDGPSLFNKVLLSIVRQLHVVQDLRQQELALRILRACPELVAPVLAKVSIDVKNDWTFFMQMAYVGRVLALPVPNVHTVPPPTATVLASTLAEPLARVLHKALKHASALVQYYACIVAACALQRICALQSLARHEADEAGEDEQGAFTHALKAWELAWRTRMPPIDVVYPLLQSSQPMRREASMRVLALYLEALPSMAYDTHWDGGQLLTSAFLECKPAPLSLEYVTQAHALRILSHASAAMDLSAKVPTPWPGHEKRSYWHFVMVAYMHMPPTLREACRTWLRAMLGTTTLFAHDVYEVDAWLEALPTRDNEADKIDIAAFWDDCLLRCMKTSYRYAERMRAVTGQDGVVSPLVATVMEQAHIRLSKGLWDARTTQALLTYVHRVCVQLVAMAKPIEPFATMMEKLWDARTPASEAVLAACRACMHAAMHVPSSKTTSASLATASDAYTWLWTSTPTTYESCFARMDTAWPLALYVWLLRLHPLRGTPEDVRTTFQALQRWSATRQLDVDTLHRYVVTHPTTQAWLHASYSDEGATAYITHLLSWVRQVAMPTPAYQACIAPLMEAVYTHWAAQPTSAAWRSCAEICAPYTQAPQLVQIVRAMPWTSIDEAQLTALAHIVPCIAMAQEAWKPFHSALPALVERAAHSEAACALLDAVLAATLPAGLDPYEPPARGNLIAMRHAQAYVPASLDPLLTRDATWARAALVWPTLKTSDTPLAKVGPLALCVALQQQPTVTRAPWTTWIPSCWSEAWACRALHTMRARADKAMAAEIDQSLITSITPAMPLHALGAWLCTVCAPSVQKAWLDVSVRHLTRKMVEEPNDHGAVQSLARAARALAATTSVGLPASVIEPLLLAIVQTRATQVYAMQLAEVLSRACMLKETSRAKLVSTLLARTEAVEQARQAPLRLPFVATLVHWARDRPSVVQATSTVLARWVYLYMGTMDNADRALASLLWKYGGGEILRAWQAQPVLVPTTLASTSALGALLTLDPARAWASCIHMPRISSKDGLVLEDKAMQAYDPWFVLNLLAATMLEREQQGENMHVTGLEWLAIVRTGAISMVLGTLSSHRAPLRKFALQLLGKIYASLQPTEFREKELVCLVLERTRDLIPPPPPTSITGTYTHIPWLPSMTCLFAAHCLRAIAAPYTPLFPALCRFLLQRPVLDTTDVPLLYNLLHSTSDTWQADRLWLLRFLRDALEMHTTVAGQTHAEAIPRAKTEWKVFKRRHVWDLLLSLSLATSDTRGAHADRVADQRAQDIIDDIWMTTAGLPYVSQELVSKRGWLSWISMRVQNETATLSSTRVAYWLTLLHRICVPVTWSRSAVLSRLADMDRQAEYGLVTTVLGILSCLVQRKDQRDTSTEWVEPALAMLETWLSYASLCGHDVWTTMEARMCMTLLDPIATALTLNSRDGSTPFSRPVGIAQMLRVLLLLHALGGAEAAVRRLFLRMPLFEGQPMAYAPRLWAWKAPVAANV